MTELDFGRGRAAVFGEPCDMAIIMPCDSFESAERVYKLTERDGFMLAAAEVRDWNGDLSPWPYEGFAGEGQAYLDSLITGLVPKLCSCAGVPAADMRLYIGGYSLAGLFGLWALYRTDIFAGAAGCSGSFWYPGFTEFAAANALRRESVIYLSLGKKEEKTRNKLMSPVGDAVRELYRGYGASEKVTDVILEWNEGGHFSEPEKRTAKGFAWLQRVAAATGSAGATRR